MVKKTIAEFQKTKPLAKNNLQNEKRLFSKFNPHANGWTQFEDKILLSNVNNTNSQKINWQLLKDLILEKTGKDRTAGSTKARYYYLLKKLDQTPEKNGGRVLRRVWTVAEDKLLLKLMRFNSLKDVVRLFNENLEGLNLSIRSQSTIKWRYYKLTR